MKKLTALTKKAKRSNIPTKASTKKFEILNLNAMNRIRGGDGENSGGVEVIITIPPVK
jgi:hypothetical protein